MGKAYLEKVKETNERFGYDWQTISESYEKECPICGGQLFVTSGLFEVLDGNTVFHCEKEDDHTFWRNPRGEQDTLMYHPDSSETEFDYLAIYKKDKNGKWQIEE